MTFLLDEHVAPAVAEGLRKLNVGALALRDWRHGPFLEAADETILSQAEADGLPLVTYDQRTIPTILKLWGETGRSHAGVVFVDHRTIRPGDIGGLVRALKALHDQAGQTPWRDRTGFLRRPPL